MASAYGRRCVGVRPTPKIPAARARKTSGTQGIVCQDKILMRPVVRATEHYLVSEQYLSVVSYELCHISWFHLVCSVLRYVTVYYAS